MGTATALAEATRVIIMVIWRKRIVVVETGKRKIRPSRKIVGGTYKMAPGRTKERKKR
jgi:hypothetical protein